MRTNNHHENWMISWFSAVHFPFWSLRFSWWSTPRRWAPRCRSGLPSRCRSPRRPPSAVSHYDPPSTTGGASPRHDSHMRICQPTNHLVIIWYMKKNQPTTCLIKLIIWFNICLSTYNMFGKIIKMLGASPHQPDHQPSTINCHDRRSIRSCSSLGWAPRHHWELAGLTWRPARIEHQSWGELGELKRTEIQDHLELLVQVFFFGFFLFLELAV